MFILIQLTDAKRGDIKKMERRPIDLQIPFQEEQFVHCVAFTPVGP